MPECPGRRFVRDRGKENLEQNQTKEEIPVVDPGGTHAAQTPIDPTKHTDPALNGPRMNAVLDTVHSDAAHLHLRRVSGANDAKVNNAFGQS